MAEKQEEQETAFEKEFAFFSEIAKDRAILVPGFRSPRVKILVPNFVTKRIVEQVTNEAGVPQFDENELPLYQEKEVEFQEGYKAKIIELPLPQLFTTSSTTGFLKDVEVDFYREAYRNYMAKFNYSMRYKKDMTLHLHRLMTDLEAVINSSKSRAGEAPRLSKSTYSHSQEESINYEGKPLYEKKKTLWQRLFGGGEKTTQEGMKK